MTNPKITQITLEDETLLTDITVDEAASIEGGATFFLDSVQVIDRTTGVDDPLLKFGSREIFRRNDVKDGDQFFPNVRLTFNSPQRLRLFDTNNSDGDVLIGQTTVDTRPRRDSLVAQDGNRYFFRINYSVTA